MSDLHKQLRLKNITKKALTFLFLFTPLLTIDFLYAEPAPQNIAAKIIEVTLGDYRYMPGNIQLTIDQPVVLHLVNTDSFTPHNFTLADDSDGLDVNVDIPAGGSVDIHLMPLVAGSYTFYCGNQLWPMDSHRKKGMEGILSVTAKPQSAQQAE